MGKLSKLQLLLASVLLSACSEIVESSYEDPQWDTDDASSSCVDEGPSYTDQMLDLSRDGKDGGRVSIRFYSDKPNVPYITVSDFHEIMTDGESMRVVRDGDLYLLSTREGMATVDVKDDYLYSMNYGALVDLSFLVAPNLSPNTMYDASKYVKPVKMEYPSTFKAASGVRLDFRKYDIDLHDDGTNVYFPFTTLADMYSDCNMHYAVCHDDKVMVNTKNDEFAMITTDPEYASKPYLRAEVPADMALYRYQELCFVFDNLFGYPGCSIVEQNGLAEVGLDATLDLVEHGPAVKKLLQSTDNIGFAWGMMALQYLVHDGGHTSVHVILGTPDPIYDDYVKRLDAQLSKYPEAVATAGAFHKKIVERNNLISQLTEMRKQAYGDVLYKANSDKTTGVIIMDSFTNTDFDAWNKYYASSKTDADWQELMKSYQDDDFVGFLYGLQQAKADGVKNLILDISTNLGGSTDITEADIALLRKNRTVQTFSQDVLEGLNKVTTYQVDSNFDGVFDEKDDTNPKFDCSGMNIAVLTSKLSFSCGNQFAAMMKDSGFTIMGERSGGGSCSIVSMLTPDGINYTLSTYRDRSTFKDFVNIDPGVPPTDGYAFDYTHFYDLDYLTTQMQK